MYFGVGGTGLIRRGSRDRWGVGYYYDGISDYVKETLPIETSRASRSSTTSR